MDRNGRPIMKTVSCGAFINILSDDPADWRHQADRAARLPGSGHVEIWLELEHLPESSSMRRELSGPLDGRDLIIHAPFVNLSLVDPWAELRRISIDRLHRVVEFAGSLDAKVVTCHAGQAVAGTPREQMLDRVVDACRELQQDAGSLAVTVENVARRGGASCEVVVEVSDFKSLMARDPAMRFTLDVGHALQNMDDSYLDFLYEYPGVIADIHLHDGRGGGRAHLALGQGDLDVAGLASAIKESGYRGFLTLETLTWDDTEASWSVLAEQ